MLLTDKGFHVFPFPLLFLNGINKLLLIIEILMKCKKRALINDSVNYKKKVIFLFLLQPLSLSFEPILLSRHFV